MNANNSTTAPLTLSLSIPRLPAAEEKALLCLLLCGSHDGSSYAPVIHENGSVLTGILVSESMASAKEVCRLHITRTQPRGMVLFGSPRADQSPSGYYYREGFCLLPTVLRELSEVRKYRTA